MYGSSRSFQCYVSMYLFLMFTFPFVFTSFRVCPHCLPYLRPDWIWMDDWLKQSIRHDSNKSINRQARMLLWKIVVQKLCNISMINESMSVFFFSFCQYQNVHQIGHEWIALRIFSFLFLRVPTFSTDWTWMNEWMNKFSTRLNEWSLAHIFLYLFASPKIFNRLDMKWMNEWLMGSSTYCSNILVGNPIEKFGRVSIFYFY